MDIEIEIYNQRMKLYDLLLSCNDFADTTQVVNSIKTISQEDIDILRSTFEAKEYDDNIMKPEIYMVLKTFGLIKSKKDIRVFDCWIIANAISWADLSYLSMMFESGYKKMPSIKFMRQIYYEFEDTIKDLTTKIRKSQYIG